MRARIIQMINNFYREGEDKRVMPDAGSDTALGEYCCLGHFDALHIEMVEWDGSKEGQNIRNKINDIIAKRYNGCYNIRNVVCITGEDDKDGQFWEEAAKMPYLFISLIRLKPEGETQTEAERMEKRRELITRFNRPDHVMAYYTYDHSEIVVIRCGKSYVREFREILSMYDEMDILKVYSVFAVKESELGDCGNIENEIIDCRLNIAIKNQSKVDEYEKQLEDFLRDGDVPEQFNMKRYHTLGNSDCLIEISQVPIRQMLRCYRMGSLLTHTNKYYYSALFNVETQFLLMEKKKDGAVDSK